MRIILQIIISNGILELVTGILAKISLRTRIWARFRLGTGIWHPPSRPSQNPLAPGYQRALTFLNEVVDKIMIVNLVFVISILQSLNESYLLDDILNIWKGFISIVHARNTPVPPGMHKPDGKSHEI